MERYTSDTLRSNFEHCVNAWSDELLRVEYWNIYERLTAYERTSLTPEEISTLKARLERAETELTQYQIPLLVIQENWNPSKCPRCMQSFYDYEPCDDGYYSRATSLERCPYCGQKIKWDRGLEDSHELL